MAQYNLNWFHDLLESDDNLDRVRELLSEGFNPNLQNGFGNTPLHTAAQSHLVNIRIARELISSGADVNLKNRSIGFTALHYAVVRRKQEMVEALLQAGADINARTLRGSTALHFAIDNRVPIFSHTGLHIILFQFTPDFGLTKMLLEQRNIDINAADEFGETPLMWAVIHFQFFAVKELLNRGADPNIYNISRDSSLHRALNVRTPCHRIVGLLLQHGADICSLNTRHETPIDILIDRIRDQQSLKFAKGFVKMIMLHYNLTAETVTKLERNPDLSFLQSVCSAEVAMMRTQTISRNLTVRDFMLRCYNDDQFEEEFENPCLDVFKPLVDILMKGSYSVYLRDLLTSIDKYQLWKVLRYNVRLKNEEEKFRHVQNVKFLKMCTNCDLSDYLSHWDLFQLILSLSNLTGVEIGAIKPIDI